MDTSKAYEFTYYIKEIREEPFTKNFIAADLESAERQWNNWRIGVIFSIEQEGEPKIIK